MTDERISLLCRRMLDDMTIRHFGEKTQKDYIRQVKAFAAFLGRSLDTARLRICVSSSCISDRTA